MISSGCRQNAGTNDETASELLSQATAVWGSLKWQATIRTAEMANSDRRERIHNLDVTVWVGKNGIEAVTDELDDQLADRDFVKVKFLRAARGGTDTETLANDLAEKVDAKVIETRGHTAVIEG